ncbi:MAG: TonB-dependent receptor plug domain-containing protein [Cytophagales bacterium]
MKKVFLLIFLASTFLICSAQDNEVNDDKETEAIFDLSLEELMNVKIVSASRSEENSFDSPLSSCAITRSDLEKGGFTAIPDALRLCQGLIVRELSNGTYDVSIRGGVDGFPAYNFSVANYTILVMIDNRPVFSSFQGGTFWQNLPVGLSEIERIEVVYGPSSPLYGPNAVSGVVNIITSRPGNENSAYSFGSFQTGSHMTLGNVVAGNQLNNKFGVQIGFNFEERNRFEESYYRNSNQDYVFSTDSLSPTLRSVANQRFPDKRKSLSTNSGTVSFFYKPKEKVSLILSNSYNLNKYAMNSLAAGTPINQFSNNSVNSYLSGNIYGFNLQASILAGTQGLIGKEIEGQYLYRNIDLYLDYEAKLMDGKLLIKLALGFQEAYVNDERFSIQRNKNGQFNGKGSIDNFSGSIKVDAKPFKGFRVIGALRHDRFNKPDNGFNSYQFIANYKINEKIIFRALTSKSYNGSFLVPTLVNSENFISSPAPFVPNVRLQISGNDNLKLMNNTMYEAGTRMKLNKRIVLDFAVFNQNFKDFNILSLDSSSFNFFTNTSFSGYLYKNLPLEVSQNGVSLSITSSFFGGKLQVRPHLTIQETKAISFSPYYNKKGAYDTPTYTLNGHQDSTSTIISPYTPNVWAGGMFTYTPFRKFNISISAYYFGAHRQSLNSEINFGNGSVNPQKGGEIKEKILLNFNANVVISDRFTTFFNVRNLLNQTTPESFGSDRMGLLANVGLRFNY